MVLVDIGASPSKKGLLENGLSETSELDKESRLFVNKVAKVKKERLLVGEKVAAAIEGAVM